MDHQSKMDQPTCWIRNWCCDPLVMTNIAIENHHWLVVEPPTPLKNDGVRQLG